MKPKRKMDVIDVIRPMHIISIIFFIAPYFASKPKDKTRKTFVFSKLIFVADMIAMAFYIHHESIGMIMIFSHIVYVDPLTISTLLIVMCYYAIILFVSNIICRRAMRFLNDLIEIDEIFESMSLSPNDSTAKRVMIGFAILEMFSFSCIFLYCAIMGGVSLAMSAFIYRNALSHVRMTILSQLSSYTFLIYYRFSLVNDQLSVYKLLYRDASPVLKKHLVSNIKTLCMLHDRLVISTGLLNRAFEIQVTATYVSIFWFSIPVLNLLFRAPDLVEAVIIYLLNLIKTVIFCIGIVLVALSCTKAKNKARRSSILLAYLAEEEFKKDDADYIYAKCLQMLNKKVKFTACGLAPIELPMLCAMFATSTTYLIILNQFTWSS